jgi:hypothetical protein
MRRWIGRTMLRLSRSEWRAWWAVTLGIPLGVYFAQLVLLCIRFEQLPNYCAWYDWPTNILRILRSTPSVLDVLRISSDEWLFEVGRKSIVYGLTVCEWRLAIEPAKLLFLVLVSGTAATNWVLSGRFRSACGARRAAGALTASGTAMTSLTAVTISWVACCGVPSWVTGLSILGLSYSSALLLQPYGMLLAVCGWACLLSGTVLLVMRSRQGALTVA